MHITAKHHLDFFFRATVVALLAVGPSACQVDAQPEEVRSESVDRLAGCSALKAAGIIASGYDSPTPPTNAIDGSLSTRWSSYGIGQSITLDLGASTTLCTLGVAWYRGNLRVNTFTISVSSDGSAFSQVFAGKSSGATTAVETYDFADVAARYVRVTVNGNTENQWASITELSAVGAAASTTSPSPAETLFGTSAPTSADAADADPSAVELGVKFEATVAGSVSSMRFYRAVANPSGYSVHLWSGSGALLATATVADGALPGWREAKFSTPVTLAANTPYVASYFTSNGRYAGTNGGFSSSLTSGHLTAPADAGVYHYGPSAFPADSYQASNYWVDVSFTPSTTTSPPPPPPPSGDTTSPTVTITSPTNGSTVSGAVAVKGNASDNVGLAKVEVQIDAGAYALASGTSTWSYTWDTTGLSGSHTINARATDTSGNVKSAGIAVTIPSSVGTLPTGSVFYLRKGATGSGSGADWTNAWSDASNVNYSAIKPGDTIYIAAGTYGALNILASGTAGSPITFKRATNAEHGTATGWSSGLDGQVIIDGGGSLGAIGIGEGGSWTGQSYITVDGVTKYGIWLRNAMYGVRAGRGYSDGLTLRYLEMGGTGAYQLGEDGIQGKGNKLLVEHCYIHDNDIIATHGDGVQWFGGTGLVLRYNVFKNSGQTMMNGVEMWGDYVNDMEFYYNVVYNRGGTHYNGITFDKGSPQSGHFVHVYNNTFDLEATDNSGYNNIFNICCAVGPIEFKNNAVLYSNAASVGVSSHSYNGYDNAGPFLTWNIPAETGRVTAADLGFISPNAADYHLMSTSPLIGKGINLGLTKDFDGRPVPSVPSIGAFEPTP